MNIVLFTQDDPIYLPRYLEPIVSDQTNRLSEIILAPRPTSRWTEFRGLYEMFGSTAFVRFGIIYVSGEFIARLPASISYPLTGRYHSVKSLAVAHDIPLRTVPDINDRSFVTSMRDQDPDLFLSVACGQKMGEGLLDVPTMGAVNIHGSLLPDYRGLSTAFWVLFHGETESGVTAHFMDSTLDTGPIIDQRSFAIETDDTMHDVYLKVTEIGASLANDVIEAIATGTVRTEPNDPESGSYFSRPSADDRREFLRRGNEFI